MPLDPSIITSLRPAPIQPVNPLDWVQGLARVEDVRAQVEQRRLAADAARQNAADRAAMQQALEQTGGDPDQALPLLYQTNPTAAAAFAEKLSTTRKNAVETAKNNLEVQDKQLDLGLKYAGLVTDQASHEATLPKIAALSPVVGQYLAGPYDPAKYTRVVDMALSRKDQVDLHQKALDAFGKQEYQKALGTAVAAINPDDPTAAQQYANVFDQYKKLGGPPEAANLFPQTYTGPETIAFGKKMAIDPATQEKLAGEAAARAQTAANEAAVRAQASANAVETARHNLAQEGLTSQLRDIERQKLAAGVGGPDDVGVAADLRTTSTGRPYVDLSKYKGKDYGAAQRQAHALGASGTNAAESTALANIDTARQNLDDMEKSLDKLPTSPGSRVLVGPLNRLEAYMQWDPQLAAWGGNRDAAIQAMKSMIGTQGVRINRAEMQNAIENDVPDPTDTQATAREKLARSRQKLLAAENGILGSPTGGSSTPTTPTGGKTTAPAEGTRGVVNGVPAVWKTVNGTTGWYKQ
jgi:hypothetical protein